VGFMASRLPVLLRPGSFPAPAGQLIPGGVDHVAGLEAELGLDLLDRCRGTEGWRGRS
jgi:hypothetical protein